MTHSESLPLNFSSICQYKFYHLQLCCLQIWEERNCISLFIAAISVRQWMAYNLPLCAIAINGATPCFLALLKAARLSTKVFLASRLSHPAEMCCGFSSFKLVNLTDVLSPRYTLIISTLYATALKWTAVLFWCHKQKHQRLFLWRN